MSSENISSPDDAGADGLDADLAAAMAEMADGDDQQNNADGAENSDADAQIADEGTAQDGADQAGEQPDEVNAVEAPSDFTAEEKEQWPKLTPEAQTLLASYSNRSQVSRTTIAKELDGLKSQFGPVGDAMKQYERQLQMLGASPAQVISGLMPYYVNLASGDEATKRQTIEFLARQFGVSANAPKNDEESDYQDPQIEALKREIETLKSTVTNTTRTFEQSKISEVQAQIDAFKTAADDKGTPKHPHFEKLESRMEGLIRGGLAKTLDEAYAMAESLDAEIQADRQKAKAEAQRKAAEEKAKAAKQSAAANKKGSSAPAQSNGVMSLDDSIAEAVAEVAR